MTDQWISFQALWIAIGLAFVVAYVCYGMQPSMRRMRKRNIARAERVRYAADVNTELLGFRIGRNVSSLLIGSVAALVVLWLAEDNWLRFVALFGYCLFVFRSMYQKSRFQKMQSFLFTERGVWLFPERLGRPIWKGPRPTFRSWQEISGYRMDGSYLQLYRDGEMVLQVEFALSDAEAVREALFALQVRRLELTDRIWTAQLNEELLFRLEDEVCETGWQLLELFDEEFAELGLQPQFGVMRNMPGDRLFEEYARSWLQINLLDEAETVQATSHFPLWQSNGSVGFLIGVRGQELIDHLQQWIRRTLQEATATAAGKGVVS